MAEVDVGERTGQTDLPHIERPGQMAKPPRFERGQAAGDLAPLALDPVFADDLGRAEAALAGYGNDPLKYLVYACTGRHIPCHHRMTTIWCQ